jgi:RHS repeat-associated protein
VSANGSSQELVLRSEWDSGNHTYGWKIEQDFSKYYFNSSTGGWEVTDKQGTVHYYGTTTASRQYNSAGIFKWFLDKVQDVKGNYMTVSYYTDAANGQLYLQEIDYTGNGAQTTTNKVVFTLSTKARTAADTPISYASQAMAKTAKLLSTVSVYGNGQLARKYSLAYTSSADTSRSLLQSVTQYGSDGSSTRSTLPDNAFSYQSSGNKFGQQDDWGGGTIAATKKITWAVVPGASLFAGVISDDNPLGTTGNILYDETGTGITRNAAYNKNYQSFWLADTISTGNPDIIYVDNETPTPHLHIISMTDGLDHDVGALANSIFNAAGHARMADVNGDGLLDFVYDTCTNENCSPAGTTIHVRINNGDGTFGQDTTVGWGQRTAAALFKMADVNGDGKADLVYVDSSRNIWVMLSTGSSFQAPVKWGIIGQNEPFNLVDVNGDGLPDIVYLNTSGSFQVALNKGTGFSTETSWGARGSYSPNPGYSLADVNGDGLPDIAFDSASGIMVLTNTGSSFMAPKKWGAKKYPYATGGTFITADLNGDGFAEFIYDAAVGGYHDVQVLLLNPDVYGAEDASDLMTSATTGIGGTYTIKYSPSVIYPSRYSPYSVQTPCELDSNDGNGNTTYAGLSFNYGYYDFLSREFRGFGDVTQYLNDSYIDSTYLQDDVGKGLMTDKLVYGSNWSLKYREWQYSYDLAGTPYSNTHFPALTQTDEIHWDQSNNPQTIQTSLTYDSYGNVTSRYQQGDLAVAGDERYDQIEYAYDTTNWLLARPNVIHTRSDQGLTQDDDLARTTLTYQPGTNLVLTKNFWFNQGASDPTITYTYDQYGNLSTQTDPNGNSPTTITYDSTQTFPQLVTDPAGHRTQTAYNYLFSKPISKTDVDNNIVTAYTYDLFGRIAKVVDYPNDSPSYPTKTYSYNNYGTVGQQNVSVGSRVQSGAAAVYSKSVYFDGLGRKISQHSDGPNGATIRLDTVYDANSRVWKKSVPYLYGIETEKSTQYTYDPLGRLLTQINPDQTSSTIAYAHGTTNYYDPNNNRRTELRDAYGQLLSVTQYPDANTNFSTTYQYDSLGNLLAITDPENNQTSITYDSLSRRTAMSDPDMGSWIYGYDPNGNLTSQTDANNTTIKFSYDAVNRVTLKQFPAGQNIQFSYDQAGAGYGIGQLAGVSDASGSTSFQYDRNGKVVSQNSTVNGNLYTLQKSYDDLGRITTITYPDNEQVSYTYDTGGNLSGVVGYANFTNFTGLGQPQGITYGNGATTSLSYNTATDSRLHSMVTTTASADGDVQVQNLTYSYDGDGNVLIITDGVDPTRDLSFGYDGMNRLITASSSRQDYGQLSFEYSPSGNILYNSRIGSYSYSGPQPHAVTSAGTNSYGYDSNGNMTNRNGQAMAYDYENRLISSGNTSFVYNYKGMRAEKTSGTPSSTTTYLKNLYECTNGACTEHIFAGTRRIASKSGSTVYYYHPDLLGGMNVATDSTGQPAETNFYYPYGEDWIETGYADIGYKFTDQEKDSETGVYYYKARYYDPVLGRFITPDPMMQAVYDPETSSRLPTYRYRPSPPPVFTLSLKVARSLAAMGKMPRSGDNINSILYSAIGTNPYTYVLNNPESGVDPYGLFWNELGGGIVVVGGAIVVVAGGVVIAIGVSEIPDFGPLAFGEIAVGGNLISAGITMVYQGYTIATEPSDSSPQPQTSVDPGQQSGTSPGTTGNSQSDNQQSDVPPDNSTLTNPPQDNQTQVTPPPPPSGGDDGGDDDDDDDDG